MSYAGKLQNIQGTIKKPKLRCRQNDVESLRHQQRGKQVHGQKSRNQTLIIVL